MRRHVCVLCSLWRSGLLLLWLAFLWTLWLRSPSTWNPRLSHAVTPWTPSVPAFKVTDCDQCFWFWVFIILKIILLLRRDMPQYTCGQRTTLVGSVLSSYLYVISWMELRSSGLPQSAFIQWAITPALFAYWFCACACFLYSFFPPLYFCCLCLNYSGEFTNCLSTYTEQINLNSCGSSLRFLPSMFPFSTSFKTFNSVYS